MSIVAMILATVALLTALAVLALLVLWWPASAPRNGT